MYDIIYIWLCSSLFWGKMFLSRTKKYDLQLSLNDKKKYYICGKYLSQSLCRSPAAGLVQVNEKVQKKEHSLSFYFIYLSLYFRLIDSNCRQSYRLFKRFLNSSKSVKFFNYDGNNYKYFWTIYWKTMCFFLSRVFFEFEIST